MIFGLAIAHNFMIKRTINEEIIILLLQQVKIGDLVRDNKHEYLAI